MDLISAIYKIKFKETNKIYIGSSNNCRYRFSRHKIDLKKNKHHSLHLQRAFNKYGLDSIDFEIIELVNNPLDLLDREQFYLDLFQSYEPEKGYNISRYSKPSQYNLGKKMSEEQKKKISKSMLKTLKYIKRPIASIEVRIKAATLACGVKYKLISPDNEIFEGIGIAQFCRDNNLSKDCIKQLIKGKQKQHKGWRVFYGFN